MARMTSTTGATSCSYDGQVIEADEAGVFDVPDEAITALFSHGFVLAPLEAQAQPSDGPAEEPKKKRK